MSYQEDWQKIANSEDRTSSLMQHFSYLSDSQHHLNHFYNLLKNFKSFKLNDDSFELIGDEFHFAFYKPVADTEKYEDWPKTYCNFMLRHELIKEYKTNLAFGGTQNFDPYDWGEWSELKNELFDINGEDEEKWHEIPNTVNLKSPISIYGNLWIYHPYKLTSKDEPVIYFLNHELESWPNNPYTRSVGDLFIDLVCGNISGDSGKWIN